MNTKGNTYQVGIINNSMTNNLETNIDNNINTKVKFGPLKLIETAWGVIKY